MAHTPEAIIKELKSRKFHPVYFLQGEEPWFMDVISRLIENNAIAEHEKGFNQVILYGKDTNVNAILSNARRFPMMAERQIVLVREAQEIADLNREEGQTALENYIKKPVPSTVLLFTYKNKTLDGRKSLAKTLDKMAILIDCKKVSDYKLGDWLTQYAKDQQVNLAPDAAHLLTEYIGNDLGRITNEIDKLRINLKDPQTQITQALVKQYVGISKEYNIFELQRALVSRDVLKANQIIQYFARDPKSHPVIGHISVLFAFFSKLFLAHSSADKSEANLARVLKISPYVAKEYASAVRKYNPGQLIAIIHYLRLADMQAKGIGSSVSEEEIMRELVFKILH